MNALPFTTAPVPAAAPTTPEAYVVWLQLHNCQGCGKFQEQSELYIRHTLKGVWGLGKASNLKPLTSAPQYNLPVLVYRRPAINTPFCHACLPDVSLSHLPPPPRDDSRPLSSSLALPTINRTTGTTTKASEASGTAGVKRPAKPTTHDLMKDL